MLDDLTQVSILFRLLLTRMLTARYLESSSIFIVYGREARLLGV
jgi:hypothetical protein